MGKASIRELKRDTSSVLGCVSSAERDEIQQRGLPVAVLSGPARRAKATRPDFTARLKSIYGDRLLAMTATEVLAEERRGRQGTLATAAGIRLLSL